MGVRGLAALMIVTASFLEVVSSLGYIRETELVVGDNLGSALLDLDGMLTVVAGQNH